MPAIAIVGAVASVSTGLAVGGLVGGMMVAGGVLSGLGTLTGNKKLARIGAVIGLAGGIGAAFSGASSAASGLNSVGGEGVAMGSAAGNAGSNAIEMGLADSLGGAATSGLEATASAVMPQSGIIGNAIAPPGSVESFFGEVPMAEAAQAGGPAVLPGQTAATQQVQAGANQVGVGAPTINNKAVTNMVNPLGDAWDKLKGFGKGTLEFVQNKDNAGLLKVGGGLVQGAMGSYQKQAEYEQALAQREAERQRFNRSILGSYINR